MSPQLIVKYVSYVVGVVALVSLIHVAQVQAIALGVCALVNIFYVKKA